MTGPAEDLHIARNILATARQRKDVVNIYCRCQEASAAGFAIGVALVVDLAPQKPRSIVTAQP